MYFKPLLLPLLAQVALSFIVMSSMYRTRIAEMKTKQIHPQQIKSRSKSKELLTDSASASDNYSNLFELPVLFYTAILLTLILMVQDSILVFLAWAFVSSRYLHSFIHVTYNQVMHRFSVFLFSSFVLLAYWVRLSWIIMQSCGKTNEHKLSGFRKLFLWDHRVYGKPAQQMVCALSLQHVQKNPRCRICHLGGL
jgi:hypothetical protein